MLLVENLFGPTSRTDKKMSSGDMTAKLLQNREILTYIKQLNVAEQGVDKKMSQDSLQQLFTPHCISGSELFHTGCLTWESS